MSERPERSATSAAPVPATRAVGKDGREHPKRAADTSPVDVDQLLSSVRARLESGRDPGAPSEPAAPATVREARAGDAPLPAEALARSFELLKRAGPLDPKLPIQSHRALVGPLIVGVKALLRRLLSPAFSALFEHQARFDQASIDYGDEVYRRIVGMEADLRTRLERVEARHALELETIERRLGRLESLVSAPADAPPPRSRDGG
ncbi:MAG: hypothetical protein U0610_30155 [bacterium]